MSDFFKDPIDFYPENQDIRNSYFYWINNRLIEYLYHNPQIHAIFFSKKF